jgi:hypothetical protein
VNGRALKWACFAVGAALLVYSVLRAVKVGFVHDESRTFFVATETPLGELLPLDGPPYINQAFLSVLLMRWSAWLLGTREWILRAPALLAHVLYLWATFALVRRFRFAPAALAAFLLLNLNPFVLELFALARGYGPGLALAAAAIVMLLARRDLAAANLAGLAVAANLSFLSFYLALVATLWLRERQKLRLLALHALLVLAFALPRAIVLLATHELYVGGDRGFWVDTVGSLITVTLHGTAGTHAVLFERLLAALVAITMLAAVALVWRRRAFDDTALILTLLLAAVTITELEHLVLGVHFLMDRTAIFFVFLFTLLLCSLASSSRAGAGVLGLLAAASLMLFARAANLRSAQLWPYDADSRQMLARLSSSAHVSPGEKLTLRTNWLFEPTINFYRVTRGLDWLAPVDNHGLSASGDYYYSFPEDDAAMSRHCRATVEQFATTGAILARDCAARY